jgi:hypothetical protein
LAARARASMSALRFDDLRAKSEGEEHNFAVEIYLGALDPEAVRVELYWGERVAGDAPVQPRNAARASIGRYGECLRLSCADHCRPVCGRLYGAHCAEAFR